MAEDSVTDPAPLPPDSEGPSELPADRSTEDAARAGQADDLRRERDEYRDRWLRKTAEFDNYRKRVERERREQAEQAVVDLILELLLVVDDFDRALTVEAGDAGDPYRKGIELIHAKLHDLLGKHGVTPIEALGTDFDPNLHQAVIQEASPDNREGEVIGELRRGYMMGDRLLRPSMVKVAKA
jgi:molecular chaperone GrpE